MTRDQREIWEREKRAVRRLRDGLGKPVDRQAVEVVAALRLVGIHTDASCGGHADRLISPYVAFSSPRSRSLRRRADEADDPRFRRRLLKQAAQHNAHELQVLIPYLECFYRDRSVPQSRRLIVQGFGPLGYRLTSQDADLLAVTPRTERRALLEQQRQEFDAFTEFVKGEFFTAESDIPPRAT